MAIQKRNNLKEKIIDDLLLTGFPLEVFVSNVLSKADWRAEASPLYIDPDNKNTRELDIYALKIYNKEPRDNTSLFSHLIIQCKKSSKPWVFFDNAGADYFWIGFYSLKCNKDGFISKLCNEGTSIGFTNHRYKNVKKHRSFHTAFKEPNQASGIYEALITSCKALEYYKNLYGIPGNTAHFLTPIVVLDGTLWSASMSKTSKIKIKQVNKLVVKFDYIFGDDKKPNKYTYQYVEVITRKEFERRINEIESDNIALLNSWVNFLNLEPVKDVSVIDIK